MIDLSGEQELRPRLSMLARPKDSKVTSPFNCGGAPRLTQSVLIRSLTPWPRDHSIWRSRHVPTTSAMSTTLATPARQPVGPHHVPNVLTSEMSTPLVRRCFHVRDARPPSAPIASFLGRDIITKTPMLWLCLRSLHSHCNVLVRS
jgi:hypothetical protein